MPLPRLLADAVASAAVSTTAWGLSGLAAFGWLTAAMGVIGAARAGVWRLRSRRGRHADVAELPASHKREEAA